MQRITEGNKGKKFHGYGYLILIRSTYLTSFKALFPYGVELPYTVSRCGRDRESDEPSCFCVPKKRNQQENDGRERLGYYGWRQRTWLVSGWNYQSGFCQTRSSCHVYYPTGSSDQHGTQPRSHAVAINKVYLSGITLDWAGDEGKGKRKDVARWLRGWS